MAVNAYAQYQQNQLTTASPARLLLMAYDGAIKFARMAGEKMRSGSLYEQNEYFKKTQAIILELVATIDPKPNPELAANLTNLYDYIIKRLVEANVNKDQAPLKEAVKLLSELRSAWAEIAAGNGQAAEEAA